MIRKRNRPHPLPDPVYPQPRYRCQCPGCLNRVPWKHFTCMECFLWCDNRSHRVRIRIGKSSTSKRVGSSATRKRLSPRFGNVPLRAETQLRFSF
jgi:hypothetical protein